MALPEEHLDLLQVAAEFLRTQQLGTAAGAGISFDLIYARFPEPSEGIDRTQVVFRWDEDLQAYRASIPT